MPAKPRPKFYAVARGRSVGVVSTWQECQRHVHGFSGAVFKSFSTEAEANEFVSKFDGIDGRASKKRASSTVAAASATGDTPTAGSADPSSAPASKKKPKKTTSDGEKAAANDDVPSSTTATTSTSFRQLADPTSLYALYFDGAARGNHVQGRGAVGGAGAVLYRVVGDESDGPEALVEVGRLCVSLGAGTTNNAAEWTALELGLEASSATGVRRLRALGDSKLVVSQLRGEWKAKEPALAAARRRAASLVESRFDEFEIEHVYRDSNSVADALSNEALDSGGWEGWKVPGGEVVAWRELGMRGGGGRGGGRDDDGGESGGGASPSAAAAGSPSPPPSQPRKRFDWSARATAAEGGERLPTSPPPASLSSAIPLFRDGPFLGSSLGRRRPRPMFPGCSSPAAALPLATARSRSTSPAAVAAAVASAPPHSRRRRFPVPPSLLSGSSRLLLRAARMVLL